MERAVIGLVVGLVLFTVIVGFSDYNPGREELARLTLIIFLSGLGIIFSVWYVLDRVRNSK